MFPRVARDGIDAQTNVRVVEVAQRPSVNWEERISALDFFYRSSAGKGPTAALANQEITARDVRLPVPATRGQFPVVVHAKGRKVKVLTI